ncbi:MAG: DUF58 domain-containing protein [Atopobiaceae bacterium]|jgi:uncharacterized protein (DUF58 family)
MTLLLLVVGAGLLYLLQLLVVRLMWTRKLSVHAAFVAQSVREDESTELQIDVINAGLLPMLPVRVQCAVDCGLDFGKQANLAVSDKNYLSEVFSLKGQEKVSRTIPLYCAARGFYRIDTMSLIGTDLFCTKTLHTEIPMETNMCVLPGHVDAKRLMVASKRLMGENIVQRAPLTDPFTLRGIRSYMPGDPMKDINWKASARTGDIKVNVHDYTVDQEVIIVLDVQWDLLLRPHELLEENIRIAANLADEMVGKGVPTSFVSNGQDLLTGAAVRMEAGADRRHAEALNYNLARIALAHERDTSAQEMLTELGKELEARSDRAQTAVLITCQVGDELQELWQRVSSACSHAVRIQTYYHRGDLPEGLFGSTDVMGWEVFSGR